MFDFSNYSAESKDYDDSNALVVGKMKYEMGGVAIEVIVRLKPKMYSILGSNSSDSKNNPNSYKALKTSIGTIIKNPEMVRFVPDHLKTKKICKTAAKKLPFAIKYIPD